MTDLPVLIIGCGKWVLTSDEYGTGYACGWGREYMKRFCRTCMTIKDTVLPVLKAHASAYQERMVKALQVFSGSEVPTETVESLKLRAARDAVLEIAGLTEKDLEKKNGGD